uniref:Uncharacterized protein n=1 Tax=Tanacetum cinerariifolium TaxID=118510 RepID=A0A6L2J0U4_TANCI|nr:hypothetical protein [Tanacetum cinerariifolium]
MNGDVYQKTLRLVECSMFAALGVLTYILSSSLAIEKDYGLIKAITYLVSHCSSCSQGIFTAEYVPEILIISLASHQLMHVFLGLTMGSLWRSKGSWGVSVFVSALVSLLLSLISETTNIHRTRRPIAVLNYETMQVRAVGAVGYLIMYSFLIRENILALVTSHPLYIDLLWYH